MSGPLKSVVNFGANSDAGDLNQYRDLFGGKKEYDLKNYFGAPADGSEQSSYFRTAMGAMTNGGKLHIPTGDYLLDAGGAAAIFTDLLWSGTLWKGDGMGMTRIKVADSSNSRLFTQLTRAVSAIAFEDLSIDLNGANQSDAVLRDDRSGLWLLNVTGLILHRVEITNGRSGAEIRLSQCDKTFIYGCRGSGMGISGASFTCDFAYIRNSAHYRAWGNTVVGGASPDTGFAQDGVDHSAVYGNTIEAMANGVTACCSAVEGASATLPSHHNAIYGNAIKGAGTSFDSNGVKVSNFGNTGAGQIHDVAVYGNVIDNVDRAGWLEHTDRLTFVNNVCSDASGGNRQFVLLSTSGTLRDVTVRGNKLYSTTNRGVSFSGGSFAGRVLIEDNEFISCSTPIGGTIPAGTIIRRNPGYNPQGVTTITVGASVFTYTAGPTPEQVFITGGTVTNIAKNSNNILAGTNVTNQGIWLEPGEALAVTYSSAPTMFADRK